MAFSSEVGTGSREENASNQELAGDEVPDHRQRGYRGVRHAGVPAIGKPFEPDEMRRQRGGDIGLPLDRVHRIFSQMNGPLDDHACLF
jgi:hypothetical protein